MSDDARPYRLNVGIALFNADGRVLIAKRLRDDGPEVIYPGHDWQMPQGGIDPQEDPREACPARTSRRNRHRQRGLSRRDRGLDGLRVSAL